MEMSSSESFILMPEPACGGHSDGLKFLRLLMVLSSISPLFILWAIRGIELIPDLYFVAGCSALVAVPTILLLLRGVIAQKQNDTRSLVIGRVEDHRGHVLVYLFAMLLPFYRQDVDTWREFSALFAALCFIVFLFWHLNFHYMNILFALWGYRVLTIHPPESTSEYASLDSFALITRRRGLSANARVVAYRWTDTLYLEKGA